MTMVETEVRKQSYILPTPSRIAKTLSSALTLLEGGKRWCQGKMYQIDHMDGHYNMCSVGAIRKASNGDGILSSMAWSLMEDIILADHAVEIPVWNDMPGRTFAEVEEMFDRAILKASSLG